MTRLHPFLFALFLTVSAYNEVRPLGDPREAAVCALGLLLLAGALFAVFRFGLKNAGKAALVTTLLLAFLGLAGELALTLNRACPALARPVAGNLTWTFLALTVLTILPVAAILRTRRNLVSLNQAFLAATAALLAATFGGLWLDRRDAAWEADVAPFPVQLKSRAGLPDIYYILLDSYTSVSGLREFYGYDPIAFRAFLRQNGFQVADRARSEYRDTTCCLASRLNMRYPPPSVVDFASRYSRNVMFRIVESSAAPRLLESAGYTIVNLSLMPLGTTVARYPISSFLCYRSVSGMLADRSIRGAIRLPLFKKARKPGVRRSKIMAANAARSKLQPFDDLEAAAAERSEKPRFFFVHSLMPHDPFVFNRDGSLHPLRLPVKSTNADYLDQLIYTTHALTQMVARILRQAPQPPVIILQGDHGSRLLRGDPADTEKEAYCMLNAILLPGMKDEEWREDLPPVNTFRLVFNHLFDAGLPYVTNAVKREPIPDTGRLLYRFPKTGGP